MASVVHHTVLDGIDRIEYRFDIISKDISVCNVINEAECQGKKERDV